MTTSIRLTSYLNYVGDRSAGKPREHEIIPVVVGDCDDNWGSISLYRAVALFWHAFQDELPEALNELFDEAAARRAVATGDPQSWVLPHVLSWRKRWGFGEIHPSLNQMLGAMYRAFDFAEGAGPHGPWVFTGFPSHKLPDGAFALYLYVGSWEDGNALSDALADAFCFGHEGELNETIWTHSRRPRYGDDATPYGIALEQSLTVRVQNEPLLWNPLLEPRQVARQRALDAYSKSLDEALDKRESEAVTKGFQKVQASRKTLDAFRWLVRYQCQGQTYSEIARCANKTATGVRTAILEVAGLMHLPLREPDRGGHRKGQRNRSR